MANTTAQKRAREWIIAHWMPANLDAHFERRDVSLASGGTAPLDAVSEDGTIGAIISTSLAETPSDPVGRGKLSKLRADLYFMLLATGIKRRLIIFTEPSMQRLADQERADGRIPRDIETLLARITDQGVRDRLDRARENASREMIR